MVDDLSTEFYVGGRIYMVEFPSTAGIPNADDLWVVFTGARVRF